MRTWPTSLGLMSHARTLQTRWIELHPWKLLITQPKPLSHDIKSIVVCLSLHEVYSK